MRLEVVTILWMLTMASCTIAAGVLAGSALLLAVGAGSAIDMFSACALYRRLRLELQGDDEAHFHQLEHRTAKLVGVLLVLTALYVLVISVQKFMMHGAPEDSFLGIAIALVAAIGMPFLGRAKIRVADGLGSKALHADAVGTLVCGFMSVVVVLGLVANTLMHIWWIDSVGAMLLVPMLLKEARDAWSGEDPGPL